MKRKKNKQMRPTHTQKLLHNKGNNTQNEKTNICKWGDQQGVSLQNLQTAHDD